MACIMYNTISQFIYTIYIIRYSIDVNIDVNRNLFLILIIIVLIRLFIKSAYGK